VSTLSARNLEPILAVVAKLAAPFDLTTMLAEVVDAAKQVLGVARGTVWLYDRAADELVLRFAEDVPPLRIPAGTGIVGSCARTRALINVPDCYADPRFDPALDRKLGFKTRCMLTVPLVDHRNELVGVLQVLNKPHGVFDAYDETLATVLAAQCAVALQRVRMTEAMIEGERLRQQLEMARVVQMSTLPAAMPVVPGYDLFGTFRPADLTGGDTFDLVRVDQGILMVLGDATGHGIGPALSVTQMQAMLRMAFRLGAELETAFVQVNNQLAVALPGDRFITAFIGLLDAEAHRIRFHSGGQGPILHFKAASGAYIHHMPTSFPLAAMPMKKLEEPAVSLDMEPGDILAVISDGVYEHCDAAGEMFGESRVLELLRRHHRRPAAELAERLFEAVEAFAAGAPQEDDMTIVLAKREHLPPARRAFAPRLESLAGIVAFTSDVYAGDGLEPATRQAVDLALEELFTNMVKYGGSVTNVTVEIAKVPGGVEVTLVEEEARPFDPTRVPGIDTAAPLEARKPGGLGLHLVRQMVDFVDYRHLADRRQAHTTFRKSVAAAEKKENKKG
jgi:sigma-B regulation protein RsbU (phosphoserine phosphatase)